ncbi:magnesium transporter MgtE [Halobiforma lacisalsi AJ5]|uniref:Magnesium transporter MgtE n=1 Tax=Natronobacterium lacisalsi AJ5 TaxID=358396 RepID=M0LHY6_NATLA|nr:magnesium transporter [Halobiforma lacisalsi]APW98467.1 magnesium transporter MgtE [Halobiforma lacisalsi AJ5]EMA33242.1 MgtE integral membrane region [Halobiforma lacisalsi AJ5]
MTRQTDLPETIAMASEPSEPFTDLPLNEWRNVFFALSEEIQEHLIADMSRDELKTFIDQLDPDEVTAVLWFTDEGTRDALLTTLDSERREKIDFLLSFDPESAAGVMSLDYVTVDVTREFSEVIERVRRFEETTGQVPTIFVTENGELRGELPGVALSVANPETETISDYVQETPNVRYDRDDEEVLEVFRQNRERSVAVLDEDRDILGVIHAEDLLRLLEEARGETLYEFTGVTEEESVLDGPGTKVRRRYKWLILNLGTAFMAAAVVGLFESTIAAVAILAAYMPVVAGMGGNAGTQAMAVTVRGISLGEVSLNTGKRVIFNEVVAGAVNGTITGVLVAVIATAFSFGEFGLLLGVVIGISMVANLVIAGFFGAITPMLLDRIGYDPATSATIFITTATDVLGFFVFLGLAQAVLL